MATTHIGFKNLKISLEGAPSILGDLKAIWPEITVRLQILRATEHSQDKTNGQCSLVRVQSKSKAKRVTATEPTVALGGSGVLRQATAAKAEANGISAGDAGVEANGNKRRRTAAPAAEGPAMHLLS